MKPTDYQGALRLIQEWIESDDDMLPEDLEPEALAWLIRQLGRERDEALEENRRLCHRIDPNATLAEDLGYEWLRDCHRGHSFKQDKRHVWAASRRVERKGGDGPYRVPAWQTADLVDNRYTNHELFDELSDALRRPL